MLKNIDKITLSDGIFKQRYDLNRAYVMKLKNEYLLQNHYGEAGLWNPWWGIPEDSHGGWESPASAIRGHFLGHFMSAAAKMYFYQNDVQAKAKLEYIIDELEKCQRSNGGEWVNSCPEKYLKWLLDGKLIGVPHYTIHKTMMGLWDSYGFIKSKKAFDILLNFTEYFIRFADSLTEEEMDDVLDFETGGMMEIFANIYGATGEKKHLALMKKYERRRLFNALLEGKDVLTNMHANTTVPEALGAAKAYEVTGDSRYLQIVKAYWKIGITDRGYYVTGGANSGEIWCPHDEFDVRMGRMNQEHCTQYNLIRLAEFLFRQTGEKHYEDFIEQSLYNSILAQQNRETGMVAYYLPLQPGAEKMWSTEIHSFWCCCGTLVQAHTGHPSYIAHTGDSEIIIGQYIDSAISCNVNGAEVKIEIRFNPQSGNGQVLNPYDPGSQIPDSMKYDIKVNGGEFTLKLRIPYWTDESLLYIDGERADGEIKDGYYVIKRRFDHCTVSVEFKKRLTLVPMPGNDSLTAFTDGPYVMAALTDKELRLNDDFDIKKDVRLLDARHWGYWRSDYLLSLKDDCIKLVRLSDITNEKYTVYFKKISQKNGD